MSKAVESRNGIRFGEVILDVKKDRAPCGVLLRPTATVASALTQISKQVEMLPTAQGNFDPASVLWIGPMIDFETMARLKNAVGTVAFLALLYALAWIFGEHGHDYTLDDPEKVFVSDADGRIRAAWACKEQAQGPFWDNGKDRDPVCHVPVRQCPSLWFPIATQLPCPYKDPLGGPYTESDLSVLGQTQATPDPGCALSIENGPELLQPGPVKRQLAAPYCFRLSSHSRNVESVTHKPSATIM